MAKKEITLLLLLSLMACGEKPAPLNPCTNEFSGLYTRLNEEENGDDIEVFQVTDSCHFYLRYADVCISTGEYSGPLSSEGTLTATLEVDSCGQQKSLNCSYAFLGQTVDLTCGALHKTFTKVE